MKRKGRGHAPERSSSSTNYCVIMHSWAHKPFAELLCGELLASGVPACFDEESDSEVKSDLSVATSVEVAAQARVAILLLSEEFFSASKWPMMELSRFMGKYFPGKTSNSMRSLEYIIPVYFRMTVTNLLCTYTCKDDMQNYRPRWYRQWEDWARTDGRVNLQAWEDTWSKIHKHHGVSMCIPAGNCKLTRHGQKIELDDDQGRRTIVERVLTNPKLGFATGTFMSNPRFLNSYPALPQYVHAMQHTSQHIPAISGTSQQVHAMLGEHQQDHSLPAAAQAPHEEHGKSTPRSAWSDHVPLSPAPSAIPQTPRPVIPEWLLSKLLFKGDCSNACQGSGGGNDGYQGRDSRAEDDMPDDDEEDKEQTGLDSDEDDTEEVSQESQDEPEEDHIEDDDYDAEEDEDENGEPIASDGDGEGDDDNYDEDSGSDTDHSGG